jgi:hypothetical protein
MNKAYIFDDLRIKNANPKRVMRKVIFLLFASVMLGFTAMAQPISGNGLAGPHHTIGELDKLGKLELTKIYVEQVNKLGMLVPFIPFNQKGDAVSLSGMGIPPSKDNNDFIKVLDASSGDHAERTDQTLNNIVPYADKEDIIKSILFLQGVIERIESGI